MSDVLILDDFNIFPDYINWNSLSRNSDLGFNFIEKYKDYLNWKILTRTYCTENDNKIIFITSFSDYVDWETVSQCYVFENIDDLKKFKDNIYWNEYLEKNKNNDYITLNDNYLSAILECVHNKRTNLCYFLQYYKLSDEFIKEHSDLLMNNLYNLFSYQKLNIDTIRFLENKNCFLDTNLIEAICRYQTIDRAFIATHINSVDWGYISHYQNLTEEFIKDYESYLSFDYIFIYQNLSEYFIDNYIKRYTPRKFKFWDEISRYQNLSETFLIKYKRYINWDFVVHYNKRIKLSYTFENKYYKLINN